MSLNVTHVQLNSDMQRPVVSCIKLVIITAVHFRIWTSVRSTSLWPGRRLPMVWLRWFLARCHNVTLQISKLLIITKVVLLHHSAYATNITRGKVLSWEYRSLWKRNSRPHASVILCWVSWLYYLFIMRQVICLFVIPAKAFARDYVITGVRLSVCLLPR